MKPLLNETALPATPPALPPPPSLTPRVAVTEFEIGHLVQFEQRRKSAGVAVLLCWGFGLFGVHRFYLGKPLGALMLVLTLVSLPLCLVVVGFFGIAAVWVWVIVDLFCVTGWVREHNTKLLERLGSAQL